MSSYWNHTVCSLFTLTSFTYQYAFSIHLFLFSDLIAHFLSVLNSIMFICVPTEGLLFAVLESYFSWLQFLEIINKSALNIHVQVFMRIWFSNQLGKYLEVWLLDRSTWIDFFPKSSGFVSLWFPDILLWLYHLN